MTAAHVDAIILAGGRNTRMAGSDKAQLLYGAARFVDHLINDLRAYDNLDRIVVVTPHAYPLPNDVTRTCENPPFGGPVAGITAGTQHLRDTPANLVLIVPVDAPDAAQLLPRLMQKLASSDVAVIRNRDGFIEPLCALWSKPALCDALDALPAIANTPAKDLIRATRTVHEVKGTGAERDYDTPESLAELPTIN
ncbi:molybdenum cofactor guanylyltransferase [Corynebacterium sp.]|uniref:molybdenum cofactor guanylyltransferase n=1 Tax=Corynebacterium sp. TaxID=1720 RepID=UPI0026DC336F|nr:molybdenum cofactor guanylyltransferase [Corynebacterium sp.]MDO5076575.1 molybdenum cofactor guanylyltransferase [Corynebacterium sp.]